MSVPAAAPPAIEQVASPAEGIFANAYLIDTPSGVVAIDATLRVSDAQALRARIDARGKPLLASCSPTAIPITTTARRSSPRGATYR